MNADVRQALRERHSPKVNDAGKCMACSGTMNHPCDVIKVLDATEQRCEHVEGGEVTDGDCNLWLSFTFCPKCGEKL